MGLIAGYLYDVDNFFFFLFKTYYRMAYAYLGQSVADYSGNYFVDYRLLYTVY